MAAQLAHYCEQDIPDMNAKIERGEFEEIRKWLTSKIHKHGKRYKSLDDMLVSQIGEPLNTKYFIFPGENNIENVQLNEDANGNAWFVYDIEFVDTANEEITALDSLSTKEKVILTRNYEELIKNVKFERDSMASIVLTSYKANEMTYKTASQTEQLAVF